MSPFGQARPLDRARGRRSDSEGSNGSASTGVQNCSGALRRRGWGREEPRVGPHCDGGRWHRWEVGGFDACQQGPPGAHAKLLPLHTTALHGSLFGE